jgi:competence protein ComEA
VSALPRFPLSTALLALAAAGLCLQASAATQAAAQQAAPPGTTPAAKPGTMGTHAPGAAASAAKLKAKPKAPIKLVDLNKASRAELMTLPGIGAEEADRIIAGRPFLAKTQLVAKKIVGVGPYHLLKTRVVVVHTKPIQPPAPAKP